MRSTYNCPSCGAPITDNKCPYCGCVIHDFATIDMGHPGWIRIKLNGKIVVTRAYVESASLSFDAQDDFMSRDVGGRIAPFATRPVLKIDMTLVTYRDIKVVPQEHPYEEGGDYIDL